MKKIFFCFLFLIIETHIFAGFFGGGIGDQLKLKKLYVDEINDNTTDYVIVPSTMCQGRIEAGTLQRYGDIFPSEYSTLPSSHGLIAQFKHYTINCLFHEKASYQDTMFVRGLGCYVGKRIPGEKGFPLYVLPTYEGYSWSQWGHAIIEQGCSFSIVTWDNPGAGQYLGEAQGGDNNRLTWRFSVWDNGVRAKNFVADVSFSHDPPGGGHGFYDPTYFYDDVSISGILTGHEITVPTGNSSLLISTSVTISAGATVDGKDISKIIMKSDGIGNLSEQVETFIIYGSTLCTHVTTGWTTTYIQLNNVNQIENVQITPIGNYYTVCYLYDIYISSFGIINKDNTYDIEVNYVAIVK